jgi:hypothetical protein
VESGQLRKHRVEQAEAVREREAPNGARREDEPPELGEDALT